MGSKQSSLSDTGSAETSPDSGIATHFTNGASSSSAYHSHNQSHNRHQNYHNSKQLKKRKSLKKAAAAGNMQLVTSVNNSTTPSLRDKIDHVKMGVSFDTSDSSDMPDAEELERRFLKSKIFKIFIFSLTILLFYSSHINGPSAGQGKGTSRVR